MWHLLLAIQEKMFGEVKREMYTTFKKLGSLYFQMGNPISASKYFEQAQGTIQKAMEEDDLSTEMRKELLESQENTYFSQYLVAAQIENLTDQIKFI